MKEGEKGGAMGLKAYANSVLAGKYEEQAVPSKPWNRVNYNIKMDLTAYQVVYCIHLPEDKDQWWGLSNKKTNLPVPLNAWDFFTT